MRIAKRSRTFSMEIAVDASMPTYSGDLGVLAGGTLRSAADLEVPIVAVTLLHRKGIFRQIIEPTGHSGRSPSNGTPLSI
jgi:starch phosphorylase